jgi:hypothetical protein
MYSDILIPTNKNSINISPFVCYVAGYSFGCRVIASSLDASAAANRNKTIDMSDSDLFIMIDDDVRGFYLDWWRDLVRPLDDNSDICMVSARLINRDGSNAPMMFQGDIREKITEVHAVPSACIAFRRSDVRFNEEFILSGYEDTFFCQELKRSANGGRIVINNDVWIIHANEQKGQAEGYGKNKSTYERLLSERGWEDFA